MTDVANRNYDVYEHSSAQMGALGDGEVGLVFTSPPYFSDETEDRLRIPLRNQTDYERMVREVTEFTMALRPVFEEISRVLRSGRYLVLQTKHIRYGETLIPLTDLHAELALNSGLRLATKVEWLSTGLNPRRVPAFSAVPRRFSFRALDTETFLVFRKGEMIQGALLDSSLETDVGELLLPLWRTPPASGHRHKFSSPPEVVRRFVKLLSDRGDLVLDPFCGFGTTLKVAAKLGRRAIGYDIDHICVFESERES